MYTRLSSHALNRRFTGRDLFLLDPATKSKTKGSVCVFPGGHTYHITQSQTRFSQLQSSSTPAHRTTHVCTGARVTSDLCPTVYDPQILSGHLGVRDFC